MQCILEKKQFPSSKQPTSEPGNLLALTEKRFFQEPTGNAMRIASNGEIVHDGFMPKENVLVERDFTISCEEVNYEIKARQSSSCAVFNPKK